MNLIQDSWIPIRRKDGREEKIAPWQIAEVANPVIDIVAPRPDFRGALYQFLIGLLQTTFAPEGDDDWLDKCGAQDDVAEDCRRAFDSVAEVFGLVDREGENRVAFMQDYGGFPENKKALTSISKLLIDAPGKETIDKNTDHFVKDGAVNAMCEPCAACAIFTLQCNAPSGGSGHRVGLRGGGPLTTLLLPADEGASLWQKLWSNVLPVEELDAADTEIKSASVFPWVGPTRISKEDITLPEHVSPLQMYWGMPRRIRFETETYKGSCDLCGLDTERLIKQYKTINYGTNYDGPWVHPLTPYKYVPKKDLPPLSIKGKKAGSGYQNWLGLLWQDSENGGSAAKIVDYFTQHRSELLRDQDLQTTMRLWCFGYDMDNMKARCWYESRLPVVHVSEGYKDLFVGFVADLIQVAKETLRELRTQIKAALFSRPKDVKGDMSMIDVAFWQATEAEFLQQLKVLSEQADGIRTMPGMVAEDWIKTLKRSALQIFDAWILEADIADMNMKRVINSRRYLILNLAKNKSLKKLADIAKSEPEAV